MDGSNILMITESILEQSYQEQFTDSVSEIQMNLSLMLEHVQNIHALIYIALVAGGALIILFIMFTVLKKFY